MGKCEGRGGGPLGMPGLEKIERTAALQRRTWPLGFEWRVGGTIGDGQG